MQWAGYSKDKKVAYLQFMLEKDGQMESFEKRIKELSKGKTWKQIQNQPLVVNQFASAPRAPVLSGSLPRYDGLSEAPHRRSGKRK